MGIADYIKLGSLGFKPSEIKGFKEKGIATDQVVKLAENGYTVADINELISLDGTDVSPQPGNEEQNKPVGSQVSPENDGAKAELDYKKQLEAQQKELEEVKKQLAASQALNSTRNLAGAQPQQTTREAVQNIFREIY